MDNTIAAAVNTLNATKTPTAKKKNTVKQKPGNTDRVEINIKPEEQSTGILNKIKNTVRKTTADINIAATGANIAAFAATGMSRLAASNIGQLCINMQGAGNAVLGAIGKTLGIFAESGATMVPYISGVASGLSLLRGAKNIFMGKTTHDKINGAMDIGLALAGSMCAVPATAGIGLAVGAPLLGARIVSGMVQKSRSGA